MADIQIRIGLKSEEGNYILKKQRINSIKSLSQLTADASKIFYGMLSNTGRVEISDKNGEIEKLISDGQIDSSSVDISIYANGRQVQSHKSTDSDYDDNILSISLSDSIKRFSDVVVFKDFSTDVVYSNINGVELLDVIFSNTTPKISRPEIISLGHSIIMDYGYVDYLDILEYLERFEFNDIHTDNLKEKSLEAVLNFFCEATQLNIIEYSKNKLGLSLSRPIYFSNLIFVPKSLIVTSGQTSLFLNNKFKRVFLNQSSGVDNYLPIQYKSFGISDEFYSDENTYSFGENPLITSTSRVNWFSWYSLTDYIGKNILYDYANGVKTKSVELFCGNLYYYGDRNYKARNWDSGDTVQVGDILYLDGENYPNGELLRWKVMSKEFLYSGYPTVKLNLQECFWGNNLDDFYSGLYQNGKMVYSWKQLINLKLVEVNESSLIKVSSEIEGDLVVSNSIKYIRERCFVGCSKLIGVEFLEGTKSLGRFAFKGCSSLQRVYLPDSLGDIGDYSYSQTFIGCSNLTIYTSYKNLFDYSNVSFKNIHNCSPKIEYNSIKMILPEEPNDPYVTIMTINLPAGEYYYTASSNDSHELYLHNGEQWLSQQPYDIDSITHLKFKLNTNTNVTLRIDGVHSGFLPSNCVQTFSDFNIVDTHYLDYEVDIRKKFWNCYEYDMYERIYKFCPVKYNYSKEQYEKQFGINQ